MGRLNFKSLSRKELTELKKLKKKSQECDQEIETLEGEISRMSPDSAEKGTPDKVYEDILNDVDVTPAIIKKPSVSYSSFDEDSENEEDEGNTLEEEKEPAKSEESKTNDKAEVDDKSEKPPKIEMPALPVVPNNLFLTDLINMGFTQEESEVALIEVNNESIELAVDKVFELKNTESKPESALQKMLQQINNTLTGSGLNQDGEGENTEINKENTKEKEELILKKEALHLEKLNERNQLIEETTMYALKSEKLKNTEVLGFAMSTSLEPSQSPIVVSGILKNEEGYSLEVKTVSYYTQYLRKLVKQNINTET